MSGNLYAHGEYGNSIASVAKIGTNTTLPNSKSGVVLWGAGEISKS